MTEPSLPPTFPPPSRGGAPEFAQFDPVQYLPGSDHIPARLVSEEENALRRTSPRISLDPKLDEFESHTLRIEERHRELAAQDQALVDEINRAEQADRQALADVALDPALPRPEPTVPKLQEEREAIRRERDALNLTETKVLEDKAGWVKENRKRLVKEADKEAERHQERIAALVGELEQERAALVAARQSTIWAACFGTPEAVQSMPTDNLMAGLSGPTRQALGSDVQLAAERIFAALRLDAQVLRTVGTHEQLKALGKRVRKKEADWQQGETDFVGPGFAATWAGTAQEKAEADRVRRYSETVRKRLWGEQ